MESPASFSRSPQAAQRGTALAAISPVIESLRLLRHPVPKEKQRLMRERWATLDPRWHTPGQGFGRQATGCGATIGIHPGCDFACTGCYLGADANSSRRVDLNEAFRQLDRLRAWLGPKGNTQITDGEVTLLPIGDLIAILRYARQVGLIPMLMTHGDSFRRRPGLLERLMVEGGLTEVSIHIDTTQRGRSGFKKARHEPDLEPLREECAALIRTARKATGLPLRAATTLTITGHNLDDVPGVVDWLFKNRDAFGMVSFQPVAQVGRTLPGLPAVSVEALWDRIASALAPYGFDRAAGGALAFGHPQCTRFEPLIVYERAGARPCVITLVRRDSCDDAAMLRAFFDRGLGGINFRDDSAVDRICRAAGVFFTDPLWIAGPLRRWVSRRLAGYDTSLPRLAWEAIRRTVRLDSFAVASHHFMSPAELATPTGEERLSACLFRVPVGDHLLPMCRVNAGGIREAFYAGAPGETDAHRALFGTRAQNVARNTN
jgi:hypothetical protein